MPESVAVTHGSGYYLSDLVCLNREVSDEEIIGHLGRGGLGRRCVFRQRLLGGSALHQWSAKRCQRILDKWPWASSRSFETLGIFLFERQEDGKDLATIDEREVRFITELNSATKRTGNSS
jgi:hypothetical protein